MNVLLINGASGSGKTTLAQALDNRFEDFTWIHPDGLMDTPNIASEEILDRALSFGEMEQGAATLVIDCQIRPSAIESLMKSHSVKACGMVLLDCPRETREQRLRARGWADNDFERIDSWACVLAEETHSAGYPIFDTSATSVDSIIDGLARRLRNDA